MGPPVPCTTTSSVEVVGVATIPEGDTVYLVPEEAAAGRTEAPAGELTVEVLVPRTT